MDKHQKWARVDRRNARLKKQCSVAILSGDIDKARNIAAIINKLERKKNEVCGI